MDLDSMFEDDALLDAPTLSISAAASLAGLHPQTLRVWEQKGLLEPYRTPGGTRMYSVNDVKRMSRISEMSAEGISVAGIKRIFALEDRVSQLVLICDHKDRQIGKMRCVIAALQGQQGLEDARAVLGEAPMRTAGAVVGDGEAHIDGSVRQGRASGNASHSADGSSNGMMRIIAFLPRRTR